MKTNGINLHLVFVIGALCQCQNRVRHDSLVCVCVSKSRLMAEEYAVAVARVLGMAYITEATRAGHKDTGKEKQFSGHSEVYGCANVNFRLHKSPNAFRSSAIFYYIEI